ncbi:MAG: MarR family transcriptional regulator [Clostridiales bacterium]|nr:MarR family transcriptional regulator [Clostridiales bacterium]
MNHTKQEDRDKKYEILRLENQLCFSLYVCSKEIIRKYKPILDPYGLTYTGYIIMMALWEEDEVTIKNLGKKLFLDSGTLTPLLKKLEAQGYITRNRSEKDERNVYINLTKKGRDLQDDALKIPEELVCSLGLDIKDGMRLLDELHHMMKKFIPPADND